MIKKKRGTIVFEHYFIGKRKRKFKKKVVTRLCSFSGEVMALPGSGEAPKVLINTRHEVEM